jgi:hypothetical protein
MKYPGNRKKWHVIGFVIILNADRHVNEKYIMAAAKKNIYYTACLLYHVT